MSIDQTPVTPNPVLPPSRHERRSSRGFLFPLILIVAGALFLANNFGWLPGGFWDQAWRFWPLILIGIGVEMVVLGRGRGLAAAGAAVVVLFVVIGIVGAGLLPYYVTRVESSNAWDMPSFHVTTSERTWDSNSLVGSGNAIVQDKEVSAFNSVVVSGPFETEIVQGDAYRVTIMADDNVMDRVNVTTVDQQVRVEFKNLMLIGSRGLKARIETPELRSVEMTGAVRGTLIGFSAQRDLNVELSGASRLDGRVEASSVTARVSGASRCGLVGTANVLDAQASGASRLEMMSFVARTANVKVSGASVGEVTVADRLDAQVTGASVLTYAGHPLIGVRDVSGGGRLKQQ